jgi:transcriptional regulator of aromatic amino acid metabolism
LEQVAIVAPTDATVLLHGETGTGKALAVVDATEYRPLISVPRFQS